MRHRTIKLLLITLDFLSIILPFIFVLSSSRSNLYYDQLYLENYIYIHLTIGIICVFWFLLKLRHYTYRKPFWLELKEILRTLVIFFFIELAIIALSKLYISRTLWGISWVIIFIAFPFFRLSTKLWLINVGLYKKDTLIIGSGKNAKEFVKAILNENFLGFNVRYSISSNLNDLNNIFVTDLQDKKILRLLELDKSNTQIVVALQDDMEQLNFWLRLLSRNGFRSVSVIPNLRGIPLCGSDMSFLFSHEMILLRLNNNLAKLSSRIIKRTVDILLSLLLLLILLLPLFIYLHFTVGKDGGKIIYSHLRIGKNNKPFKCLKFRSMVVNSDEVLKELLENDLEARAEWEKDFKLKNDPRITKIGKFLRRTSLDELPQLLNVLKGEMSLVGPRPIIQEELERYEQNVDYYLMAKPGMTGLWQVSGRNDVDYETRVYFDTWYVKNWSLWNDIAILFKTISVVLKRNGAY